VPTIERLRRLTLLLAWLALGLPASAVAAEAPAGEFTDTECVACHVGQDAGLLATQRDGPHAAVGCSACHGATHGRLPRARDDATCSGCHAGAAAASHANSKHGVLLTLAPPDWNAPLQRGRYRAPGCAYCHLHDGDHGNRMDPARGREQAVWVCGGCHAPRFATTQLEAGARLVAVAELKRREAAAIAGCLPTGDETRAALLARVDGHLRNVRLGAGHQSPDYQWWYGQPALDGDLIRLRDRVEHWRRGIGAEPGPDAATDAMVVRPGPDRACDPR